MKLDFWPIGPLLRVLSALAAERKEIATERAALAAERATLADRVDAIRRAAEAERDAHQDAKEYVEAKLDDAINLLQYERDVLAVHRDGLAGVLADPALSQERRLAMCELAIVQGRLGEAMSVLEAVRHDPVHRPTAARGIAMCNQLLRSDLLQDLGWKPPEGGAPVRPIAQPLRASPPGARDVVLVFLGVGARFFMQIASLHPFLKPFGHHVLYLRDMQWSAFLRGVDGLGASYEASLARLRDICDGLGAARIYCYGASMGGFGALRYGLDLGARRVLAIETMTTVKGDVCRAQDEHWLADKLGPLAVDLRALYRQHPAPPPATLYYGADNRRDTLHAERFADVPGARVIPIAGSGDHDCLGKLMGGGRFPEILTEFLTED
ncbi:MAG TPA: hypothetical protein VKX28_14495 [Xanthobacteraceae bacterium]|nr:hypothetical protein [Xanthobacteraceae bacterium]